MKIFIESFIGRFIVAFIVATFAVAICIRYDASDKVVIVTYIGVAIATMLVLGAFDENARAKFDSIRRRMGIGKSRSYGQAAIFVGTACLFVGSPQDCDELADDLQHYAQQTEVKMLTGNETFEVL